MKSSVIERIKTVYKIYVICVTEVHVRGTGIFFRIEEEIMVFCLYVTNY